MAKIAFVFLLFALFVFCNADEATTQSNEPIQQLGSQLINIFNNMRNLEIKIDEEAMKKLTNNFVDNAKVFVENANKNLQQN
ncbi:hypothetical protein AWZ03_008225 [Drosophila navojoa]|uniref:Uncharacterized protein n=1 Tax=Drosophila navojoa TaxID=7232 RepID=A0A484B906_DRONA|nr:hypothetical protein AWZ03_008225 [Drosophila navojoa]